MNRANQRALFQATNQGLLGIRQAEINYYLNLNLAFGTQAALIGGFTYGVFTQNQVNDDNYYSQTVMDVYWILSAATIAAAVHVIINTMLLQVLGPGLALHGPIGSIVRATDGMKVEQKQIVTSFIVMMLLFAVSTTLSFWVVMNFESALGSTLVFVIAARYWYYYTERIYLRFYWDPAANEWDERSDGGDSEHSAELERRFTQNTWNSETLPPKSDERRSSSDGKTKSKKSKWSRMMPKFGGTQRLSEGSLTASPISKSNSAEQLAVTASSTGGGGSAIVPNKQLAMEGYLTKSGVTVTANLTSSGTKKERWERRYFTLTRTGLMFYYKNRTEFRSDSKASVNRRPIKVHDYNVIVASSEEATGGRDTPTDCGFVEGSEEGDGLISRTSYPFFSSSSVASSAAPLLPKQRFQLTLLLKDEEGSVSSRRWLLRCDTKEELDMWVAALRDTCPNSFPYH